jgi:hypothetical protein
MSQSKRAPRLAVVVSGDTKGQIDKNYGPEVWRSLADSGFADRKSIGSVGFCRDVQANTLVAVLPKAYSSQVARESLSLSDDVKSHVFRLIRVFNKIARETKYKTGVIDSNAFEDLLEASSDPVLDSLEAAIKLRNEFRHNGLYFRKKRDSLISKGNLPINWQKTMNKYSPHLQGGEIFYSSTVHNTRRKNLKHPLSDLHIACLKEILSLVGDKSFLALPESSIDGSKLSFKNPKSYLRDIANDVFDERGQKLKKLISVYLGAGRLREAKAFERNKLLAYTADFENIWEFILRHLFDKKGGSREMPMGQWFTYPNVSTKHDGITPEIDGAISSGDLEAFIDAKDYRVINGARFGSPGDYYKQVIYRLLTQTSNPDNFFNILVFPGYGQSELFKIHGCHHWKEIPNSRVFEIQVDYELAVNRWLGESSFNVESKVAKLLSDLRDFEKALMVD